MYRSSQDINIVYSKFSFVYVVIDIYIYIYINFGHVVVSIGAHGFMCNFSLCVRLYFLSSECIHFSLYLCYIGAFQGVCILLVYMVIWPCRQVKSHN